MKLKFVFVLLFLAGTITTRANVKLPLLFQNHMVLQRDKPCTIWGTAANEENVTVNFNNEVFNTTAKNGKWKIIIPGQPAGGPYTITIKGNNLIKLSDVLFGDVWICGGQSNMQFSVKESKPRPDTSSFNNNQIRLFTVGIGADFIPQQDLKSGSWKIATVKEVNSFTAAGFFFGSYLQQHLKVPIGLISSNLGATAIEEWMSNDAISAFPQFQPFYNSYILPGKSIKEMTDDFEKIKSSWKKNFYLKDDPGLKEKWYLAETYVNDWKTMDQPSHWEDNELRDYDGSVWFRKTYDSFPKDFMGNTNISLGQVDDYNTCWVNGVQVGEGFGNMNMYTYPIPDSVLRPKENVVVVRVFDAGGKGGMYNMFWNPFLAGTWKYKRGVKIDASVFKKPLVPNSYIFGTPTILYNANIAPLTMFSISGFIWYQGEANTGRAVEYKRLLPAMINDWRKQFNQGALPFLMVQLPNFGKEPPKPEDNDWAELREAQASALRLPKTAMAVTIDIGEADNLHPQNKLEVGNRLAMAAMEVAYSIDSNGTSARYKSMRVKADSIIIEWDKNIECRNKYEYIRGFAMAGADNVFYWAKACVIGPRSVIVYNPSVKSPVNVRYLWSGTPGIINLYGETGLPAAPFRTDSLPLKTEYNFYEFLP